MSEPSKRTTVYFDKDLHGQGVRSLIAHDADRFHYGVCDSSVHALCGVPVRNRLSQARRSRPDLYLGAFGRSCRKVTGRAAVLVSLRKTRFAQSVDDIGQVSRVLEGVCLFHALQGEVRVQIENLARLPFRVLQLTCLNIGSGQP